MKQLISILVFVTLFLSSLGFAAKKKAVVKSEKTKITQASLAKKKTKVAKKKKSKSSIEQKQAAVSANKWNGVCQELLDDSVQATLQLEKSVNKKKKITKNEFNEKIQDELLVVQLNAWVCALSTRDKPGIAAEELFLKDFSELVQTKRL